MKSAFKYILLALTAFILSVFIYKYITNSTNVQIEPDILFNQANIEKNIFSDTSYGIDNPKIIVNPYGNSPLTALVIFETKDLTSPTITVEGKDENSTITNTFLPAKKHILPIYGLYPNKENKVTITVSEKEKELNIKTENIPDDLVKVKDIDISEQSSDLYFVTTDTYPAAFDSNGDLRWYLTTKYTWDISRLHNGHLLIGNNKLIDNPYYSAGLVELDLLGNIYYEYNIPSGYNHSVYEMNNGNLLFVSNNLDTNTVEDYVIEIDRATGKIYKSFNFEKIMKNLDSGDWLGIDSVYFDQTTNSVTIAGSKNNTIVNIDYPTGEINYIVGDVPNEFKNYQINQKLKTPLSVSNYQNSLTYYSNGNIYESIINNSTKSIEHKFKYKIGNSNNVNVQKTAHGYLYSSNKMIKELINDTENTINFNQKINNVQKMSLYANDTYTETNGVRLGETGITETTDNHMVLFHKNGTEILKKYNVNIYKDALRLVVSGNFDKNDEVEIILDNVLDTKTYKMNITDEVSSKYINEEGISGKYYIYLRINGTIYKTFKCVTMY